MKSQDRSGVQAAARRRLPKGKIKPSIEELLTRPLKKSDPRRLPRSTPGMRDYITDPLVKKYKVDIEAQDPRQVPLLDAGPRSTRGVVRKT